MATLPFSFTDETGVTTHHADNDTDLRDLVAMHPDGTAQGPARVRDSDGDVWDRGADGLYRITAWGTRSEELTLAVLVNSFGPVETFTG